MSDTPVCLVIAGPSGVGKSTLIRGALERSPQWRLAVSATTRPIREGEIDGREYHFLDRDEFERRIVDGGFLEWAVVYGNLYGTPLSEIDRAAAEEKHLLLEVDTIGCLSLHALRPEFPLIAILPPSIEELKKRLTDRATEDQQSLKRRFSNIMAELQRMRGFSYAIVNDNLEVARQQLLDLMKICEQRLDRVTPRVDALLNQAGGNR
jgi:guanylate kinase